MNLRNKLSSDLLEKDKNKAQVAAAIILDNGEVDAWRCLVENSDYLFDYVKEKAANNLYNSANINNYKNVFKFTEFYAVGWDDCVAKILAKFPSHEVRKEILELLEEGEDAQKAYAVKYLTYDKELVNPEKLFELSKQDFEPLKINCAQILGMLKDESSYIYNIELLKSEDDWEKLEAAQFLTNYGNKDAIPFMLEAMRFSGMAEYVAGEIAAFGALEESLCHENLHIKELALECFDNIINGLVETWPLDCIFSFKVYELAEKIMIFAKTSDNEQFKGKYAQLLLKLKAKINLILDNDEYKFDCDKNTLQELEEIGFLLGSEDENFWGMQKTNILEELRQENLNRKLSAIATIKENNILEAKDALLEIIYGLKESELVLLEAIAALKSLGFSYEIEDKNLLLDKINDLNIRAMIENIL